ncbi:MAG: hypothetical protein HWD61_12795 [Parachlamydiaceae bacterium]|nr:MAG: hypothetical protein HWD61_12795 [Parachlamydiaceae bacterium]
MSSLKKELANYTVRFNYPDSATLEELFEPASKQKLSDLVSLQIPDLDERSFATELLHYPLNSHADTLQKIRHEVRLKLWAKQFLTQTGEFDEKFIHSKDINELSRTLNNLIDEVKQGVNEINGESIFGFFKEKILGQIKAIKTEQDSALQISNSPGMNKACQFFKEIAQRFFKETIEVEFLLKIIMFLRVPDQGHM